MSDPDRLPEIKVWMAAERAALSPQGRLLLLDDMADWLVGEVERLRDLLGRLEWAGQPVPGQRIGTEPRCPVCRVPNPPHDRGCWLAAALGNDESAPPEEGASL